MFVDITARVIRAEEIMNATKVVFYFYLGIFYFVLHVVFFVLRKCMSKNFLTFIWFCYHFVRETFVLKVK